MEPKEINKIILKFIPEIKNNFKKYSKTLDGINTGSTVIVADLVMPTFRFGIESNNELLISHCNDFFDWMIANINDDYVETIFYVSIFENIESFNNKEIQIFFLNESTRRYYEQIKKSQQLQLS